MTTTPKLGLTLMSANMAQKEVVFNEAILAFDALFAGSVLSASLSTPPGSPALGDAYVVAASPTDAWSGKADYVAFYYNGWQFFAPPFELRLYNVATESFIRYLGPSLHWVASISEGGPSYFGVRTVTTSYTLIAGDVDYIILANFSSAGTITVPPHSSIPFAVTTTILVEQLGSGGVTIVAGAGVTLNSVGGDLALAGQYAFARLTNTAVDVWQVELSNIATGGTLAGLTDVSVTEGSGIDGHTLAWNNTDSKWEAYARTLSGLSDVFLSDPPSGTPIIVYDSGLSKWVYGSLPTNSSFTLAALGDVSLTEGSGVDGDVLYWNNTDSKFELKAPALGADGPSLLGINTQTASYTLALTDVGKLVDMNVGTANNLTIPPNSSVAIPIGDVIIVRQRGAGATTIVAGAGVTVNALSGTLLLAGQYGIATLTKVATDTWEASLSGLASGGGSSTLAADTDVNISSPTDGQALVYNSGASKWENTTLSGGGGALLPPQYEIGPFAPPQASWFSTTSASGVTVTLANVADVGMTVQGSGFASTAQLMTATRATSGWGSAWAMTARFVPTKMLGLQYAFGVGVMDSTGKIRQLVLSANNSDLELAYQVWNSVSYYSSGTTILMSDIPRWMRVRLSSGNLYFGLSYDGKVWLEAHEAVTANLADASYVGFFGNQFNYDADPWAPPTAGSGALITYYDDPDYPASGHETLTSATIGDLADVTLTSPTNGQVLTYNSGASKWENATSSGGGGALLPPYYENGPFAPPSPSWFDFSGSYTTTTGTAIANQGMLISAVTGTNSDNYCYGRRSTSAWGSSWTVTARLRMGNAAIRNYPGMSIVVEDSSGKMVSWTWISQGALNIPVIQLLKLSNNHTYNSSYFSAGSTIPPEMMRVVYDGTHLTFGASWDGGNTWENYQVSATDWLSSPAYVGIGGDNFIASGNTTPAQFGILCTYYDDPDYPASGHENLTSATLASLADVNVTEGSGIDGKYLKWDNATSKWIAATVSGGGGGSSTIAGDSDVAITSPAANDLLSYDSGSTDWKNKTLTALLDAVFGNAQGNILYRGASNWAALAPGTAGQILTTSGASANPAWTTPSATPPTPPTIVQSGSFCQQTEPFTMGSAPTAGNLLVAIVGTWTGGANLGSGWTLLASQNASSDDIRIAYKLAGPSETTSQSPYTGLAGSSVGIWELSGISGTPAFYVIEASVGTLTPSLVASGFAGCVVLGAFLSEQGAGTLPTISGATAGATSTSASGVTADPRSMALFDVSFVSAGSVNVSATYTGTTPVTSSMAITVPGL